MEREEHKGKAIIEEKEQEKVEKEADSEKHKELQRKAKTTLSITPTTMSGLNVKKLHIDPEAVSNNMSVKTESGTRVVHKTGNIYENFNGTASKEISYSRWTFRPGELLTYGWNTPEIITVTYDHVGYVDVGAENAPKLKDIGARLIISDIILGAGPRWKQDDMVPRIELSNNFYSGILYQFIEEMDL